MRWQTSNSVRPGREASRLNLEWSLMVGLGCILTGLSVANGWWNAGDVPFGILLF